MDNLSLKRDLYKKFNNIKFSIGNLTKDIRAYGYKYANLEQALTAIKEAIKECGSNFDFSFSVVTDSAPHKRIYSSINGEEQEHLESKEYMQLEIIDLETGYHEMIAKHEIKISKPLKATKKNVGIGTEVKEEIGTEVKEEIGTDYQRLGSAHTYLRRYLLCLCFNIATEDDDGATAPSYLPKKPQITPINNKPFINQAEAIKEDKIKLNDEQMSTVNSFIELCKTKAKLISLQNKDYQERVSQVLKLSNEAKALKASTEINISAIQRALDNVQNLSVLGESKN
jgi:hypothetical protein